MKISTKEIKNKIDNSRTIEEMSKVLLEFSSDDRKTVIKMMSSLENKILKIEKEKERIAAMWSFEEECYKSGYELICGIDEAGRGPLAGPVVAGAVILPKEIEIPGINDSKKISEKKRDEIYDIVIEKALYLGVGIVDNYTIDEINILNATKEAMKKAVKSLGLSPEFLLIDAVKLDLGIPFESPFKGDERSISIAAASIIAKVTRDRIMDEYSDKYPDYYFNKHKGYGTKEHYLAIEKNGITDIHRKSFLKKILE